MRPQRDELSEPNYQTLTISKECDELIKRTLSIWLDTVSSTSSFANDPENVTRNAAADAAIGFDHLILPWA